MKRSLASALSAALAACAFGAHLSACRAAEEGSLVVEARVASRPVAHETLHLLDEDLIRLAMEGGASGAAAEAVHRQHPRLRMLAGLMNGRRFSAYPLGPDAALLVEQSRPLWEPRVLRSAGTDEAGRADFARLKPGHYWLMGLVRGDGRIVFWDTRVTVERGHNRVVLDETNALTVSRENF